MSNFELVKSEWEKDERCKKEAKEGKGEWWYIFERPFEYRMAGTPDNIGNYDSYNSKLEFI